jgi:hypothetical protein
MSTTKAESSQKATASPQDGAAAGDATVQQQEASTKEFVNEGAPAFEAPLRQGDAQQLIVARLLARARGSSLPPRSSCLRAAAIRFPAGSASPAGFLTWQERRREWTAKPANYKNLPKKRPAYRCATSSLGWLRTRGAARRGRDAPPPGTARGRSCPAGCAG